MATTSLWCDEMTTVKLFSSHGPETVMTDYQMPNNHIFFSLVNSLTPFADSFHTLRVRMWSFIAVLAALLLVIVTWFRDGRYLEAAVFTQVCAGSHDFLDIVLQARGYGFLFFFAVLSSFLTFRLLRDPNVRTYATIAVCTVLGTWTVPLYVLFGGMLMLVLFLFTRDRAIFVTGVLTFLAIVLVHLPVAGEILRASQAYADKWGYSYANFGAVVQTFHAYLPEVLKPTTGWQTLTLLFGPVVILALDTARTPSRYGTLVLVITTILFLFGCLMMQTPPVRTTAFVLAPLAIAWLALLSGYYRHLPRFFFRGAVMAGVVAMFLWSNYLTLTGFSFTPIENWLGTSQAVNRIFPLDMGVYPNHYAWNFKLFVDPPTVLEPELDTKRFAAGEQAHVDALFLSRKPRFRGSRLSPIAVDLFIPQREWRGSRMIISYAAPPESHIARVLLNETEEGRGRVTDRDADTGIRLCPGDARRCAAAKLTVMPDPDCPCKSVTLLFRNWDPRTARVTAWVDGRDDRPIPDDAMYTGPRGLAVGLDTVGPSRIEFLLLDIAGETAPPELVEMWGYCSREGSSSGHTLLDRGSP
jgi:hypothetical protein